MTTYMHCRPCCCTNILTSFHSFRPGYITTSNYQFYTPSPYHHHHHHDQAPPPITTSRHRRRLDDPIITYASNYYATLPRQMTSSPPQPPPLPPPPRIYQKSDRDGIYCDLFNLLECPSPPSPPIIKQRRKYNSNDYGPRRHHRPIDFENAHTKVKNTNDRKRHHQQLSYSKEKKRQDDKLSSTKQYNRSPEKTKKVNDIYQRHSSNKGFFRRIVRNYFCMPSTIANNGYSS